MTIGPQMPLKSMFDTIVRDKGKDDRMPDQKPAKDKDLSSDFSFMVQAAGPKLKLDKEDAPPNKVVAQPLEMAESDKDNDVPDAPTQGIFGQAILAFEQLLDRQKRENGDQPQPVDKAKTSPEADTAGTIEIVEADQGGEKQNPTYTPDKKSEKRPELTAKVVVEPSAQAKQELIASAGEAKQPISSELQSSEAPKGKTSVKPPVEHALPPSADVAATTPSQSVQAEAKLSAAASMDVLPVQTTRPSVTDVQVLSERSNAGSRTLVIQLQPIELGTVTARMRLTPEGMHIQLTAENTAMAEHLAKDHDALGRALQRAGVADDATSIAISVIDRSGAASNAQTGQQNLTGHEQQTGARASGQGQSGFQGTPGDRSGNQRPFGEMRSDERMEKAANPGIEHSPSRGLVV